MNHYVFVFGNTPTLSRYELLVVLHRNSISFIHEDLGSHEYVRTSTALDTKKLMQTLGGVVKIAQVVARGASVDALTLAQLLRKHTDGQKKVTFGMSVYRVDVDIAKLSQKIKKQLTRWGFGARFILPKAAEKTLSSIVVAKQSVAELLIVGHREENLICKTIAVQDFASWNTRDYQRPFTQPKAGMLPPKVARMMLNITIGNRDPSNLCVLDPYCGAGTILAEALMLDMACVYGADIQTAAVHNTQENLQWLQEKYRIQRNVHLRQGDATRVNQIFNAIAFDMIVTEPFMGSPIGRRDGRLYAGGKRLDQRVFNNLARGLVKMYTGSLKSWHAALRDGGRIGIVMPEFRLPGVPGETVVKKIVDTCEKLGYTPVVGPVVYSRPQAVVRRNFYVLQQKAYGSY